MKRNLIYSLILFSSILYSCNMEKEIDLALPEYERKMVIECYLEPGKPYRTTIIESVSYFEEPSLPTVDSALVVIIHNGIFDTLKYDPYVDPVTGKFYNYRSPNIVPADYNSEFSLRVADKNGRIATGTTTILPPVPIDTVEFQYNEDEIAFPLTRFKDNSLTLDYYRYFVINPDTIPSQQVLTSFALDDLLLNSSDVALGSAYELNKGDSVIISLFHITKPYFDFLESVDAAQSANGNPFGQPASIKSNINGGLGIFTGLSNDTKYLRVP